jgi:hypothetical protein
MKKPLSLNEITERYESNGLAAVVSASQFETGVNVYLNTDAPIFITQNGMARWALVPLVTEED